MKVRNFLLENEKGQQYDMNNYKDSCFLTSPTQLGYSNSSQFEQIGNTFVESNRRVDKKDPTGIVYFKSYDKCREFANFIEQSEKLKFVYIIPFKDGDKTFYRDVSIKEFQKTEKKAGMLACPIIFNGLSLWYEKNTITQTIEPTEDEVRWDFKWDSKFTGYDSRSLQTVNEGHVEAPIEVEIDGHVLNPEIELYVNGELIQTVSFTVEIDEYEKLLYGTKENEFYVKKQNTDGTTEDLYEYEDSSVLDFDNDNVIRLPKGRSCEIRLNAETDIEKAKITVYNFYKFV